MAFTENGRKKRWKITSAQEQNHDLEKPRQYQLFDNPALVSLTLAVVASEAMQIEISLEATKRIEATIGEADSATINRIFERVTMDKQLLLSLLADPVSPEEADAIREGIADYEAGNLQTVDDVDEELRQRFGFAPRSQ